MHLVTQPGQTPFLTPYFDMENHFVQGMVVFSKDLLFYTDDGKTWEATNIDHL